MKEVLWLGVEHSEVSNTVKYLKQSGVSDLCTTCLHQGATTQTS